jgi:hypothetical protein
VIDACRRGVPCKSIQSASPRVTPGYVLACPGRRQRDYLLRAQRLVEFRPYALRQPLSPLPESGWLDPTGFAYPAVPAGPPKSSASVSCRQLGHRRYEAGRRRAPGSAIEMPAEELVTLIYEAMALELEVEGVGDRL